MNMERIQNLKEVLRNVRSAKLDWNMSVYRCETSACAAGHYVEAYPDCGLIFGIDVFGKITVRDRAAKEDGIYALTTHFDITFNEAEYIFMPFQYMTNSPSPEDVLDHIKTLEEKCNV